MSNEIATYSMIYNKLNLGTTGNECPTKTQILAISSLITISNESTYGANECVRIDDINKQDHISSYGKWNVTVSANPTSLPSSGGTSTITASAKRTVYWTSGKTTEETAIPTLSTDLGSISNNVLTLGENTSTSNKTATITAAYGGVSATCTVIQEGEKKVYTFVFIISPQEYKITSEGGNFKGGDLNDIGPIGNVRIDSYYVDENGGGQVDVVYDVCYENGEIPTVQEQALPDWIQYRYNDAAVGDDFIIDANTTGSPRTATIWFKQQVSGKMQHLTITQYSDNYVFTWSDGTTTDKSISAAYSGGVFSYGVVTTLDGNDWPFHINGNTNWIDAGGGNIHTAIISVSENLGAARSGEVILTQQYSSKLLKIKVNQDGKV